MAEPSGISVLFMGSCGTGFHIIKLVLTLHHFIFPSAMGNCSNFSTASSILISPFSLVDVDWYRKVLIRISLVNSDVDILSNLILFFMILFLPISPLSSDLSSVYKRTDIYFPNRKSLFCPLTPQSVIYFLRLPGSSSPLPIPIRLNSFFHNRPSTPQSQGEPSFLLE